MIDVEHCRNIIFCCFHHFLSNVVIFTRSRNNRISSYVPMPPPNSTIREPAIRNGYYSLSFSVCPCLLLDVSWPISRLLVLPAGTETGPVITSCLHNVLFNNNFLNSLSVELVVTRNSSWTQHLITTSFI